MSKIIKITDRPILYDWLYSDDTVDIPMYLKLAGNTTEILECGIGTGRIAIPLAKKGKIVYGIDNSEPMLQLLKEKIQEQHAPIKERIHYFNQDMRDFNLNRKFAYVYVPFSTFNYLLTLEDQRNCLNAIKNHLTEDGLLVLELLSFSYQPFGLVHTQDSKVIKRKNSLSAPDETIELSIRAQFDSITQIVREWRYFKYYDEQGNFLRTELVEWDNRFFFIGEVECLLESCGFEIIDKYGDHSLKRKLTHKSEFAVITAKQK